MDIKTLKILHVEIMLLSTITRNLKVENYVLFGGITEDYGLGDSLSDSSAELFQRGKGEARIYRSF